MVAPDQDSFDGIVTVSVVLDGTVVTINFLLSKSDEPKLDPVIVEKLSNKIISLADIPCALPKVIVTADDPLVVVKALVRVFVDLIGCMS